MDQWLGGGKDNAEMDTRLAKVEVGWEEESKLGQQVFDGLRQRLDAQSIRLTERGKDVQYLQRLVAIVQPQMRQAERYRKIQLIVADSDLPNAYSIPGGRLVFTRGMLNQAGSEAAVVCVLGHELAHLDRGHLLRRLKLWKLANIETSPAGVLTFDRMREQMGTLSQLFLRPFRPEEELEADRDGATWCYGAGYDPKTLEQVYVAMDRAGVSSAAFLPAFMRSHPLTADRLENLRTTLAGLETAQPRADLYLGRQNLLQRLTRAQREFNE
jgi:predicted Zn-dependent protease